MAILKKSDFEELKKKFFNGELKVCVFVKNNKHSYYVVNGDDDDSFFDYVESDNNVLIHSVIPAFMISGALIPQHGHSKLIPDYALSLANEQRFSIV